MVKRLLQTKPLIILFCIILLGLILRTYLISSIPNGLYQDETAIGYNAYSILETGKDEHGKFLPLYFKSFGDFKLPVYIYLTAGSIGMFGVNEFAVRLPSIIFGLIAIAALYFLVKEITNNEVIGLLASFLLTINPWHLHFSRAGFEVQVATSCMLLAILFFLYGIKKEKLVYYLFSLIWFSVALYTYNLTRLLSPLLLFLLITFFWKDIKKFNTKQMVTLGGIFLLILSPFVFTIFSSAGAGSAKEALIFSSETQADILQQRSYLNTVPTVIQSLLFNKYLQTIWVYLQNAVSIFSPSFLFINGSMHGNHSFGIGMFHVFEALTIIVGFYAWVIKKIKVHFLVFSWLVVVVLVVSLSKEVPHGTRGFPLIIPITIFSSVGLYYLASFFQEQKNRVFRYVGGGMLGVVIVLSFLQMLIQYFVIFPQTYAVSWGAQDKAIAEYLARAEKDVTEILIDSDSRLPYTSLAFYQQINPQVFQKTVVYGHDSKIGYNPATKIGKYTYTKITGDDIRNLDKKIIVTAKDFGTEYLVKQFDFPPLPVVFAADGEIRTAVNNLTAYRVYSSANLSSKIITTP